MSRTVCNPSHFRPSLSFLAFSLAAIFFVRYWLFLHYQLTHLRFICKIIVKVDLVMINIPRLNVQLHLILKPVFVIVDVEWRPALELSERGVASNSQGSVAGPSTDSSPSSADDPSSNLQQVSSGGGGSRHHPVSDSAVSNANHSNAGGAPNSGRNSQRRRSTRHQNYLNRSQLHQAVDLPEGYGVPSFLLLITCICILVYFGEKMNNDLFITFLCHLTYSLCIEVANH